MGCSTWDKGCKKEIIYQDAWVDGHAIVKGGRECEFRYQAIRKVVKKIKRPIKVLDIGANMGYFSFRLAEEFDGLFVMIEGAEPIAQSLLKLCRLNRNKKSILLKKSLSLNNLKKIAEREHFDVVLALSIIHHFDEPYQEVFDTMRSLGSYLIFEPPIKEERTLNQSRIIREPIDFKRHNPIPLIKIPTGSRYNHALNRWTYLILCKEFQKQSFLGISYKTFLEMNGVFPLIEELRTRPSIENENPDNFILTGTQLFTKICVHVS